MIAAEELPHGRAKIGRAGIVILAVAQIVTAGACGGIAGVDGAAVEVVARGTGNFQGGGRFSGEDVPEAEQKQDGERRNEAQDAAGGVGLHDGTSMRTRGRVQAFATEPF
jgi:hypothetical protein